MKLLELEIHNVRGIHHLLLKPAGRNFVIYGPNGSGKSAIVDAIDFLLTGRISRLTGKGTAGITLHRHGPHIDHKPEEATVRAIVMSPGGNDRVEIKRCIAHPNNLECDKPMTPVLRQIMTLAWRGQYVLTRREILKYITAEAGTRAEEVQELLNVSEIEETRKSLVQAHNSLDSNCRDAKRAVDTARKTVNETTQREAFSEEILLQVVNQNRAVLSGQPISALCSTELKMGLTPLADASGDHLGDITLIERDIEYLRNVTVVQNREQLAKSDEQLRTLIRTTLADPKLLRILSLLPLTEQGMKLIDETGSCPLCDKPWPTGELHKYLEQRISTAQVAAQHQECIKKISNTITSSANNTIASINKVIGVAQMVNLKDELQLLQSWLVNLQELLSALDVPLEKYLGPHFSTHKVQLMLAPDNLVEALDRIIAVVKAKYPATTPKQTAWDTLTRLEENLKALEKAKKDLELAGLYCQRATVLLESFQKARDTVLGKLYEDIKDRFVNLYQQLHGLDEGKFVAKIEPEGAGLKLEVDFYGRGTHPPHALHSEGHQDSMGLCLYLALAEQLTEGLIDLVILDDVVMSVDADHRRDLCRLLATSFPDRQFLITTHDRTWANQLKSEGIVDSQGTVEFYNWHVETGPQVNYEVDMWRRIEDDLGKNDVPSAAARLRRGLEQFLGMVCDALQAQVVYKLNGRWELGDLLPAAMGQYRKLLKQGKKAAQLWENNEIMDKLEELDSTSGQIFTRLNVEQWAVNAGVHYNNWANFLEKDFRPVVEAFQDLCSLFVCSKTECSGMLRLINVENKPIAVRCQCGEVNWNLTEKGKNKEKA